MTEGEALTSRITSLCKEIGWLKIQILTSKKNGDETEQAELQARLNALLTEHTQLQREQANHDIGDVVECRDGENEEWQHGVVTSLRPLLVRPMGFEGSFEWEEVRKSKATLESLEARQGKRQLEEHVAQIQLEIQVTQDTDASADLVREQQPQQAEDAQKTSPGDVNGTRLKMKQSLESACDSGRLDQERVESPLPFVETVANAVAAAEAACKRCAVRTPDSFSRHNGGEEVNRREQRSPTARRQQVNVQRTDVHMQQRIALAKTLHISNGREPSREHSIEVPRSSSRGGKNRKQSQVQMSQLFDTLHRRAQASSKEQKVLEHRARQLDKSLRSAHPETRLEREKAAEKAARAEQQNAGSARKKAEAEVLKLKLAFDARLQKLSERDRSPDPTVLTPAVTPQRSRLAPGQRMQTSTAMFDRGVASLPAAKSVSWGSQLAPATSKPGRINGDSISAKRKGANSPGRCQTRSQQVGNVLTPRSIPPSIANTPSSANAFVWRQHSAGSAGIDDRDDDNTSDNLDSRGEADSSGEQGLDTPAMNSELACEIDHPNTIVDTDVGQSSSTSFVIEPSRDRNTRSNSISLDIGPGMASDGSFVPLYTSETELCTLPSTPAGASRSVPVMQADVLTAIHGSTVVHSSQLRNALEAVAGDSASRENRVTRENGSNNIETSVDSANTPGDVIQSGGDADGGGGSPLFAMFPQRWEGSEVIGEPQNEVSAPPRSWGTTSVGESVSMEDEEEESRSQDEVEAPVESIAAAAAITAAYSNTHIVRQGSQPLRRQWSPPPANRLSTPIRSNKPSEESSLVERAFDISEAVEGQTRRSLSSGGRRSQEVFSRLAGSHTVSSQARQDEISVRSSRRSRVLSSPPRGDWQH